MIENGSYPRLLVLANNSFSKSNSNGRTLGSLLQGWPKDRIAQFCISSDGADFDVCENYFCVTDSDVFRSTLHLKASPRRNLLDGNKIDANSRDGHVVHRKTTPKMFARNIAWQLGLWRGREFDKWIADFAPDIIMLQNGESYFMHSLAMKLAKSSGAHLAIFNTEGHYFFKKDYFAGDGVLGRLLFKLYRRKCNSVFKKYMSVCEKQIYGNELLRRDNDREFGSKDSKVIYTGSSLTFNPPIFNDNKIMFSYLGNMGFDRPDALKEVAEVLGSINPDFRLDVYGFAKSKQMEDDLRSCPFIRFHGAVPYEKVVEVMQQSHFLFHVETQTDKWAESLRYGFSTKIADSIASGKLFVLYSSPDIAGARYMMETKAGIFASTKEELKQKVTEALDSVSVRDKIAHSARIAAEKNHNPRRNSDAMKEYLCT